MLKIFTEIKNLSQTKKSIFLNRILFFIVFGLIIPVTQTHALFGKMIDSTVSTFVNVLIGFIFQAIAVIGNTLLGIAGVILQWVTSDTFIKLSYTNPADNFILDIGWKITRDLTNIGFVVVLIIIGLATALRIKDYQWQKLLPKLVVIILLINFTPVIIGLIVDASNIVMNFFLQESRAVGWGAFSGAFTLQYNSINELGDSILSGTGTSDFLGKSIVLAIYGFAAAAVLFVFSALFLLRYIAIWILVILSPIAFFAWILPGTKKYFTQWWQQLLQWSFIGATTAFFLYLSHKILEEAAKPERLTISSLPGSVTASRILDNIFPYIIVVVFLYIGFFVSLKSGAWGANAVIGWAKGREKTVGKWMGRKTRRGAQKLMGEEKWKGLADRLAGAKGGMLSRVLTSPLRPIGRGMLTLREAEIKAAEKAEEDAKKKHKDAARNLGDFRKPIIPGVKEWGDKGGRLAGIVEQKQVKDVIDLGIKEKEVTDTIKNLIKIGDKPRAEKITRGFLGFLRDKAKERGASLEDSLINMGFELKDSDREKGYTTNTQKLIAEARTVDDIKALGKEIWKDEDIQKAVHKFWDGTQIKRAAEEFGAAFIEDFQKTMGGPKDYETANRKGYNYLKSSAAQELGIGFGSFDEYEIAEQPTEHIKGEMRKTREDFLKLSSEEQSGIKGERLSNKVGELQRELNRRIAEEAKTKKAEAAKPEAEKAKEEKKKEPPEPSAGR